MLLTNENVALKRILASGESFTFCLDGAKMLAWRTAPEDENQLLICFPECKT